MSDTIKNKNRLPFTMLQNVLLDDEEILTIYEKMALWVLLRYANEDNRAFPSYNTIGKKMRCSPSQAYTTIKSLIDKKIISKRRRFKDNNANTSNLYTIENFDKIFKVKQKEDVLDGVRTKKFRIKKPPQFPQTEAASHADIPALDYASIVSQNIDFENLKIAYPTKAGYIDDLYNLMVDVLNSSAKNHRINKGDKPADEVKGVFLKLNDDHINYVLDCLGETTTERKNARNYLLTTLYNSYFTKDSYYHGRVNHDLYGG
jgi:hypothetical protein